MPNRKRIVNKPAGQSETHTERSIQKGELVEYGEKSV